MRTVNFFLLALMCASLALISCDREDESILESEYFSVQNGTLVEGSMPSATGAGAPTILSVSGNPTILAGGSNQISISTRSTVTDVLVGVEGVSGYYKVPQTAAKSTQSGIMVVILISPEASNDFTIVLALANANSISTHYTVPVTVLEGGTGQLQVSLSWDRLNDVDLHLTEPGGEVIFFGNTVSEIGGELDIDSNAGCGIDSINNENITYSDTAVVAHGEYTVGVDLWSSCNVMVNTNYVVTVRFNGNLITPTQGTNPYRGVLQPDEDGPQTPMKFRIGSGNVASTKHFLFQFDEESEAKDVLSPHKLR